MQFDLKKIILKQFIILKNTDNMNKLKFLTFLLFSIMLFSCTEAWNEHYNEVKGERSALNIAEYIQSQADLSTFSKMLAISGYDSLLSKSQTYTVWAPLNAGLTDVNLNDTAAVTDLVKNHITRFTHTTSGMQQQTIFMLAKKFVVFKREGNSFSIEGKQLVANRLNTSVVNGTVHCIESYIPYLSNIWEFIGKTPGLDSLRKYLNSQSSYEFDVNASVEIGTNENGQSVYDSVITFTNPVLNKIGMLHIEDSSYYALLPNNTAWIKAYNQIKNGYKTFGPGGEKKQHLNTQHAIVNNLIFKKTNSDPTAADSIVSTTGSIFRQPAYLFTNATDYNLSNGKVWKTDSIRFKASESWQKPVRLEAENSDYGRKSEYANIYVRSSLGSQFSSFVSDNKFLVVDPTTASNTTQNAVTFPVPNTLSGKYNIYCVFVPANIAVETNTKPYRLSFYLSYMNANGTQINDAAIDAKNTVTLPNRLGGVFQTKGSEITKLFVTQFTFPWSNIINDKAESANITVKLKVKNEVKITETALYNRSFRVDYIILEPAE